MTQLPPEFLERLQRLIPPEQWHAVLRTFEIPRPTTLRANRLKVRAEQLQADLEQRGFQLEPVPWYPDAFILRGGRFRALQDTPAYREGQCYVQSLSSMLPALVLDPQPGEHILDLAAAPGSKTTQIACLMQGRGTLVANDKDRVRFYKLQANVIRQGAVMATVIRRPGESFRVSHPGVFDRVLVDVPCSTEGLFHVPQPKSYAYWKLRKVHEMAGKQRRLLAAGLSALRPGGVLVYATCTFAPEENEAVVDWALKQAEGTVSLEDVRLPIPNTMPGMSRWGRHLYAPMVSQTVRVVPTLEMEGFFVARFTKRGHP